MCKFSKKQNPFLLKFCLILIFACKQKYILKQLIYCSYSTIGLSKYEVLKRGCPRKLYVIKNLENRDIEVGSMFCENNNCNSC